MPEVKKSGCVNLFSANLCRVDDDDFIGMAANRLD